MGSDDVQAVRALAHPVRLRLLDQLRFEGPSTATALASVVGESSGSTSYHLRQLARYGYIEESARIGRERFWRYRERPVQAPAGRRSRPRRLVAELLAGEARALDAFLAAPHRARDWDDATFYQARALRLTAAELDRLRRDIEALLAPLRRADAADAPDTAQPVSVVVVGYPQVEATA